MLTKSNSHLGFKLYHDKSIWRIKKKFVTLYDEINNNLLSLMNKLIFP